jgi:NAD(P)-dependent dehydrogenase (short-subunit alcohol dehydrogenase family)
LDLGLSNSSVLVTGSSRGIGAAIALAFAREGVSELHLAARDGAALKVLGSKIAEVAPCSLHLHETDLSSERDREALRSVVESVDILVNNAGAIPSGSLETITLPNWREGWELKVWGYIHFTQMAYSSMCSRKSGVIVNNIGLGGERPDYHYVAGSTGNAALMALTRAVGSHSIDHGVRVVGVNTGLVATDRWTKISASRPRQYDVRLGQPGDRVATPEEAADLIVFVSSERASYMSGSIVTLDGGVSWRNVF